MTLRVFIDTYGVVKLCHEMQVRDSCVYNWRAGKLPKAKHLLHLKRLSKGKLTCDSMIEQHFLAKK